MKITFYGSNLCPRCHITRRILFDLTSGYDDREIEEVDVLRHPLRAWSDGIRLFPALKIGGRILSGVWIGRKKIQAFLNES